MSSLTTELLPDLGVESFDVSKRRVRPMVESDIVRIADLQQRIGGDHVSTRVSLLKRLFFDSPWHGDDFSSLICEDAQGRLLACLGVMPQPMVFRERPIRAAAGHHFIIDQSRAGARAAIELTRRFLHGPQDLSLAVWDDFGRRIWTSLGGNVTPLHSFVWTRALRPARYILDILKGRGLPASAAVTLHPACQALDMTLSLLGRRAFPSESTTALSDDLDPVTMLSCLSAFASDRLLKPRYDVASLSWVLNALAESTDRGQLHKVAVRAHSGRPLGWYLYYLSSSGTADVLQVGGKDDSLREVLHHLFDHARRRGAVSVTGPMDARLVTALSESRCTFHRSRNAWTLIHSRDEQIAEAIHAGDAFLSRLEMQPWYRRGSY